MATIIPNSGAAGMSLGENLANIYSSALREGLNQATQANMARNTQLTNWLINLQNAQLGLLPDVDFARGQSADVTRTINELNTILSRTPAGTGMLKPFVGNPVTVSGTMLTQNTPNPLPQQTTASGAAQTTPAPTPAAPKKQITPPSGYQSR